MLMLPLFGGCLFTFIRGVQSEAACYNHDYTEVIYCEFGCCGNETELECCLHGRLVPYIVAGALFLIILGIAILLVCYRKRKDLKRILNTGAPSRDIVNDHNMAANSSTEVGSSLYQCTPSTHTMTPPPYMIGPPPPYTEFKSSHESLQQTPLNTGHLSQPNLISNEARTPDECCCNPIPQTSHQYNAPPPPYGVYADIAHTNRPRT